MGNSPHHGGYDHPGNGYEHGGGNGWGGGGGGLPPSRYKTELCRNYLATLSCQYNGCAFAHGVDDLRACNAPGSSYGAPPPTSTGPPPMSAYHSTIEALLDQLRTSAHGELESLQASREANERLEATLRREQTGRRDDAVAIEAWERHIAALKQELAVLPDLE
jgi:hypothetical protein